MIGRRPDSTLGKCKIVIGMLTVGMISKLLDIFKLVSTISVLEARVKGARLR